MMSEDCRQASQETICNPEKTNQLVRRTEDNQNNLKLTLNYYQKTFLAALSNWSLEEAWRFCPALCRAETLDETWTFSAVCCDFCFDMQYCCCCCCFCENPTLLNEHHANCTIE